MDKFKESTDSKDFIDRKSFILGMITAFSECISGESKKCALSPPFHPEEYRTLKPEGDKIADEQNIDLWLEKNPEIAEEDRVYWWVMYKFSEALEEYKSLRDQGYNPIRDFDKFKGLLSYGTAWGEGAESVVPKMRGEEPIMNTVNRVLFKSSDWPPEKLEK